MRGMHLLCCSLTVVTLSSCADQRDSVVEPEAESADLAPLFLAQPGRGVPDRFMVILEGNAAPLDVAAAHSISTGLRYERLLTGFTAVLSAEKLTALRGDPRVKYVEQDQMGYADVITQDIPVTGAWGLDRIDQRNRGLSGSFSYSLKGTGVNVYLLDSGIDSDHPQFIRNNGTNRVQLVAYYEEAGESGEDCDGHGTHVAGTIAGKTYGVAKNASIHSIRVLDCEGSGFYSVMISALEWIAANSEPPAVINMSIGGGLSKSMNEAIDAIADDILVIVSAGNSDDNSCSRSPAGALKAFSVAAMDSADMRAAFSSWGRCVSLYAPGVNVLSAQMGGGTVAFNGTSMAAPHVTGVAALYLDRNAGASGADVRRWLLRKATPNKVRSNDPTGGHYGTPNRLLYSGGL